MLGKTQAEVKDKLRAAIEDSKKLDPVKAGNYTLEQWMKLWYSVYVEPQVRYSTREFYHNAIDHHIIPKLGSVKLEKLTMPTVLQRAAQERSCAEEKPAGAERTRSESSHGAMRSCGAEQSVGACGGRKADFSKSCEELQNSKERAQRDENFA